MPELPDAKKARFVEQYGLSAYDAEVLVAERATADYFEQAAKGRDAKLVANWVTGDLFGALNRAGLDIAQAPVTAERLGKLLGMIQAGTISGRIAKDVFQRMFETGADPEQIVAEQGLAQISDTGALEQIVDELIAANPAQVASYRKEPEGARLVRRPGHEGHQGPGQSPAGERPAAEEAWMTVTPWTWTMSTTIEMRERISMAMHNPPHPGGIVRRQCLEPLGLTVTDAAKGLGVTRQALSDLVNEKAGISVDMAIRLSKAFGSSPEAWLGMQTAYDLWQARDRMTTIEVQRFEPA